MKKILFVRPSHDDVTSYLHYYSKELLKESNGKGFKTINKEKEDANKQVVVSIIEKHNPEFIMFNGHGSPTMICGHQDKFIIKKDVNHDLIKNKTIYSLSCSSASELGKAVADNKTTFIGYVDEFALGMDVNSQAVIHRDKRAKLFLEPSNLLVKSLLKGNSAGEAVTKAKSMMRENISRLRTDPFPDAKDYLPYLYNNYLVLEVMGNESVVL
tara:strand:- start:206 stop:844 length:639 start_codon:yes stop_codon:yes gene_type:complete